MGLKDRLLGGIIGLCVGDALGVPVEFESRESLQENPVTDMRGCGTHDQLPGTWSDDTSMTLCLLDSLAKGLDYTDIVQKFLSWLNNAEYTPYGKVFDVGRTTMQSILRFSKGMEPILCGGASEHDNGNGSLMRILPLAFYLHTLYGYNFMRDEEAVEIIHNMSALTHAHNRSKIACVIYTSIAGNLIDGCDIKSSIKNGIDKAKEYYEEKIEYFEDLKHFSRIFDDDFINLSQDEIKSSGYVVDTLEAALWCLLNAEDYKSCVLKAVNLGGDADTVATVAGGLAGIYCGREWGDWIPLRWVNQIARLEYIQELCESFYNSFYNIGIQRLCAYIPYFENIDPDKACKFKDDGEFRIQDNYIYEEKLLQFVNDFCKSGLSVHNYQNELDRKLPGWKTGNNNGVIENADFELLKIIFTKCIRTERFCDGAWASAVESGLFLNLLRRLNVLFINGETNIEADEEDEIELPELLKKKKREKERTNAKKQKIKTEEIKLKVRLKNYYPSVQLDMLVDIGRLLQTGSGLFEENHKMALAMYEIAAAYGEPEAMHNYGWMAVNGLGMPKNIDKAISMFENAASNGAIEALINLGNIYENMNNCSDNEHVNYKKAAECYKEAMKDGNEKGAFNYACLLHFGKGIRKNYKKAFSIFSELFDKKFLKAYFYMGLYYQNGFAVKKDYDIARRFYINGANLGDRYCCNQLGFLYANGYGVKQNFSSALKYYKIAAENGDSLAKSNIGLMYQEGEGVEQDYAEAVKWYKEAISSGFEIEQESADTLNSLGWMYQNGLGIAQDYKRALELYSESAVLGNRDAQSNLGVMYERGWGTTKDLMKAVSWYIKAADRGDKEAKNALVRLGKM
jgi:ADP-ribosylglycohydrolase/TPR repeat protein